MYHFKLVFWGFFQIHIKKQNCQVIQQFCFQFSEKPPYYFPHCLNQYTFPSTVDESFLSSTSLPAFVTCFLFDDSHSERCEVLSHCGSDLISWSISSVENLHVIVACLHLLFGKMSLRFCPFFNKVVCLLLKLYELFVYVGY